MATTYTLAHNRLNDPPTASLAVAADILFTYQKLDKIDANLKECENSSDNYKFKLIKKVEEDLEDIIKVYNENVRLINDGYRNTLKNFEYPSLADRLATVSPESAPPSYRETIEESYPSERNRAEKLFRARLELNGNLAELAAPQRRVKDTIKGVIERVKAHNIPIEQLPKFDELFHDDKRMHLYEQELRKPQAYPPLPPLTDASSPSTESPTTTTSTTSSTTPASPSVDVAEPVQAPQTHSVTIHCPLGDNQTLGICQDPEWEKKPISFTSSDHQNWKVELPRQHEFKYVIIEAGKDLVWETRGNRCLKPDSSNSSSPDEAPRF